MLDRRADRDCLHGVPNDNCDHEFDGTRNNDRSPHCQLSSPGLLPATRSELLGRWVPAKLPKDERVASSYVFLSADGSWSGVDRCNNFEGKWDVGQQGAIDAVLSYISAVGCSTGVNFELWLTEATHAGFYGSTVVLVDAKGHVTGRFRRG
jgi:hypothetical protein